MLSALAHTVYNFCGMFVDYCGKGTVWTVPQIIFTAIIGTVIGAYLILVAVRSDRNPEPLQNMLGECDGHGQV